MRNTVTIENIEQIRLQEGIDDIKLREDIRGLRVGDLVKLTFLQEQAACADEIRAGETLSVRITSMRGGAFRGKLANRPASRLLNLRAGSPVVFTTAHIHSLIKEQPGT